MFLKSSLDEEWQHFYQQTSCGAQPPVTVLMRSLHGGGDSHVCVRVSSFWQYVFMLVSEDGEEYLRTSADAAGRLRTTDTHTHTQHHPVPPPPLCGVAIIKMIYLTIGPRLRD